jgi:release factor glutamine methyltransferase
MQKSSDTRWTILDLVNWTTGYFKSHDIDSPRLTVELFLAEMLGIERIDLYLRFDQPLSEDELSRFKKMIKRRLSREPVAYILGRRDFWESTFAVNPDVLIPRPETEFLVEAAMEEIPREADRRPRRVLELGTGSGAIIVSLAAGRRGHLFFASDRSMAALRVARKNAAANGVGGSIHFFAGSWLSPLSRGEDFDLILANPPYIPRLEIEKLVREIRGYEPSLALDGGEDGLGAVREILEAVPAHLAPGGRLLMEIGEGQDEEVKALVGSNPRMELSGFVRDYAGIRRVMAAKRRA